MADTILTKAPPPPPPPNSPTTHNETFEWFLFSSLCVGLFSSLCVGIGGVCVRARNGISKSRFETVQSRVVATKMTHFRHFIKYNNGMYNATHREENISLLHLCILVEKKRGKRMGLPIIEFDPSSGCVTQKLK